MSDALLDAVQSTPADDEVRQVYLDWLELEDPARAACFRADRDFSLLPLGHPDYADTWERLAWHTRRTNSDWAHRALHHYDVLVLEGGQKIAGLREIRATLDCSLAHALPLWRTPASRLLGGLFGAHAEALRQRYERMAEGILGLVLCTEPGVHAPSIGSGRYAIEVEADDNAIDAVQRVLDISWNDASERIAAGPITSGLTLLESTLLEHQLEFLGARIHVTRTA